MALGHLPVPGVLAPLLVYGSNPATAIAVPWLPRRTDVVLPVRQAPRRGPGLRVQGLADRRHLPTVSTQDRRAVCHGARLRGIPHRQQ
ncbi:hypothetical protein [Pedococcus sp. 5OH_020]|uniref:hypothetical protein n=1 Tax=Pedococcus sp. 5OH_020 TaxID=2989814 RepID=UPI0022E9D1B5|nr:hypothetical protein [Pedococcus sp. 5OH_020]